MSGGALIVGAGQAGLQLAASLRQKGYKGEITMLGREDFVPYQRPPLSKDYLLGQSDEHSLVLRKPSFFEDHRIRVVTGTEVVKAEVGAGGGGSVATADGRELAFDHLALTLGCDARPLPLAGGDAPNVHLMRTIDDAQRLRAQLDQVDRVAVVGGGFIGLEAAAVMSQLGKQVTVLEAQDRLLPRVAGPELSDFYLTAHRKRGVDVRLGVIVEGLDVDDTGLVEALRLSDGEQLEVDVVIVGIGVTRSRTLVDQLGLEFDQGIVVDAHARTNLPGVVAAGDCAVFHHPRSPLDGPGCIESVQNAVDQAKVAAATICGDLETEYETVPWFWSDQYDLKLQMAGLCGGHDEVIVRGDPDEEHFALVYLTNGQLTAVHAVNRGTDFMAVRRALADGRIAVDRALAQDIERPLKDALT